MPQFLLNGAAAGLSLALMAVGFALIYHSTGVFHVAHAAVFTVGAYSGYWMLTTFNCGVVWAAITSVCASGLAGFLLETFIYRPLAERSSSSLIMLISSFGCYSIAVAFITLIGGTEARSVSSALSLPMNVGGLVLSRIQAAQIVAGVGGLIATFLYLRYTNAGRWTKAMATNRRLVLTFGVNEPRLRSQVFIVGSIAAGAVGFVTAIDFGVYPDMGFQSFMAATVAVLLAGSNRFVTAGLAAVALGVAQNLALMALPAIWKDTMVAVLLLAVLLFRRRGGSLKVGE